jgi:putative ABC transport system substrate-binding protein
MMKRREFIAGVGATAAAWPLPASGQRLKRVPRVGILMPLAENEAEPQAWISEFLKSLGLQGWKRNDTITIDIRWAGGAAQLPVLAKELADLRPDVLLANGTVAVKALEQVAKATPLVFVQVSDPIASGLVKNLAAPGGNVTGFTNYETSMAGKWLQLIKEIAPATVRALVIANSQNVAISGFLLDLNRVASTVAIDAMPARVQSPGDIDEAISAFGREATNGSLLVLPDVLTSVHYAEIVALAKHYRLPAVYPFRFFANAGGLLSYGVDGRDLYRRAAFYVDRILKGAHPAELPVQQPVNFELVINRKTANALGLTVPNALLARADEVIE